MPELKASLIIVIYSLGFTLKNFKKSSHAWHPLLTFLLVGLGQSWGQPGVLGLFGRDDRVVVLFVSRYWALKPGPRPFWLGLHMESSTGHLEFSRAYR